MASRTDECQPAKTPPREPGSATDGAQPSIQMIGRQAAPYTRKQLSGDVRAGISTALGCLPKRFVKAELGLQHALASKLLYTDGAQLLVRYAADDDDLEVARTRQRQLTETVKNQLQLITYAGDGYARRLQLPSYGPVEVVVDPEVGFGYPLIKGAGARVKDVLDRFWAGDALRTIAYDFDLSDEEVEAIFRAQTKPPS